MWGSRWGGGGGCPDVLDVGGGGGCPVVACQCQEIAMSHIYVVAYLFPVKFKKCLYLPVVIFVGSMSVIIVACH